MSASRLPIGGEDPADAAWEDTIVRDIAVGRRVGEYVIRRRIGTGGMGIVYEAEHPQIGRRVAIKLLRPDHSGTRDLLAEARVIATLKNRHIIDVFGFGELPGLGQYLVMDLLEGTSLDEEIRQKAPMTHDAVIPILDETCVALAGAHAKGVIHRDLKPQNMFLVNESAGTRYVKVLDFGLAKRSGRTHADEGPHTPSHTAVGTPEYMAPELAQGLAVDCRADLYSLGVTAFEMLTGRLPFQGENAFQIVLQHVNNPPPRPSSIERSVQPALDDLVMRLLSKQPELRPPSAEALRAELRRIRRELAQQQTNVARWQAATLHDASKAETPQTPQTPQTPPAAAFEAQVETSPAIARPADALDAPQFDTSPALGNPGAQPDTPLVLPRQRDLPTQVAAEQARQRELPTDEHPPPAAPGPVPALDTNASPAATLLASRDEVQRAIELELQKPFELRRRTLRWTAVLAGFLGAALALVAVIGALLPRSGPDAVVEPVTVPPPPTPDAPPPLEPVVQQQPVVPLPPPEPASPPTPRLRPHPDAKAVKAPVAPGQLKIIMSGFQASVELDGEPRGWTPLPQPLTLTPGDHALKLTNPNCDCAPIVTTVRVAPGASVERKFHLDPK